MSTPEEKPPWPPEYKDGRMDRISVVYYLIALAICLVAGGISLVAQSVGWLAVSTVITIGVMVCIVTEGSRDRR